MIVMTTDFRNYKKIVYIPDTRPLVSTLMGVKSCFGHWRSGRGSGAR